MVCDRCIESVRKIFLRHGKTPGNVILGEVNTKEAIDKDEIAAIDIDLRAVGFSVIDRTTPILVQRIKTALIDLFSRNEVVDGFRLSSFLTEKFPYDYSHMSRVFSHHEEGTIEQYVIKLRIERAKELLTNMDLNISEVAYRLGYASAAHFSRQFKKIVGLSPSVFRNDPRDRKSLQDL